LGASVSTSIPASASLSTDNYETNPNSSQLIKEAASNSNGMNSSRKVDKALI
jgi:hypothetical protein